MLLQLIYMISVRENIVQLKVDNISVINNHNCNVLAKII